MLFFHNLSFYYFFHFILKFQVIIFIFLEHICPALMSVGSSAPHSFLTFKSFVWVSNQSLSVSYFYLKLVFLNFQKGEVGPNFCFSFIVSEVLFIKCYEKYDFLNSSDLALFYFYSDLHFSYLVPVLLIWNLFPKLSSHCGTLFQMVALPGQF